MTYVDWNNYNYVNYINHEDIEINNLPLGIGISTMCASCKLNTKLFIPNIEKYLELNYDDILTIDPSDKTKKKTLLNLKIKPKRQKKIEIKNKENAKNYFYNQITVVIRINNEVTDGEVVDINKEPKINLKLFKNGSVQMSGCKTVKDINIVLNKIIYRLKETKAKIEDSIIIDKDFIESPKDITILLFKIDMINSNYRVNMNIDRSKLYNLFFKKKMKVIYEPCIRACVIIKYVPTVNNNENKEISIFIFQKGNIIITGAKSRLHIIEAYNFITNILITHKNDIIKLEDNDDNILSIYNDIMNEKILKNIKNLKNINN
jgi:TATA-box binding protein (TBP) (component of TFIID and TFIIIB)